jgi:hypothetical protein
MARPGDADALWVRNSAVTTVPAAMRVAGIFATVDMYATRIA